MEKCELVEHLSLFRKPLALLHLKRSVVFRFHNRRKPLAPFGRILGEFAGNPDRKLIGWIQIGARIVAGPVSSTRVQVGDRTASLHQYL